MTVSAQSIITDVTVEGLNTQIAAAIADNKLIRDFQMDRVGKQTLFSVRVITGDDTPAPPPPTEYTWQIYNNPAGFGAPPPPVPLSSDARGPTFTTAIGATGDEVMLAAVSSGAADAAYPGNALEYVPGNQFIQDLDGVVQFQLLPLVNSTVVQYNGSFHTTNGGTSKSVQIGKPGA